MLAEFIQLPKEGDTVGPYLLRNMLSSSILGGFYQATHRLKHENVLLHILPEALMRADTRFLQRYRGVVEQHKKLPRGPAIGVVEMHQISGNLIIQYPEGNYRSMNDVVLDRDQPLPEERVRDLLIAIGKGLMEAAKIEQGHFFMTPDFLFLNEDGEVRIAGIGLFQSINYECFERFVSGAVIPVTVDKKRSFNALEILSPEIRNFKSRDARSDFYCIGMCAYFMLTGTKPERRWATPTKARKEIGQGWDLFISHCLEPKPADRFPNYKAYIRDLENIEELAALPRRDGGRLLRTLNSLPLPKAVENALSMRFLLLVRLVLLGVAGVLTIGTASIFHQIIFSDLEGDGEQHPIRRVLSEAEANLVVSVSPDDAVVDIKGPQGGRFLPAGRTLFLKGRRGLYTLTVSAPRHRTATRSFELAASDSLKETVVLAPDFATLQVHGAVGTEVYVLQDEDFLLHLGTIDSGDGLLIDKRLLRGTHRLVGLHSALLPSATEPVRLRDLPVEITFDQPPRPTELVVTSDPEGAAVFVDDTLLGLTPLSVEGLDHGRFLRLRIAKDGYRPVDRDLNLGEGERLAVDAGQLEIKVGSLRYVIDLSMPNPPDIREIMLSIDGQTRVAAESGELELPEGTHLVEITHPDYQTLEQQVMVFDRQQTETELILQPKPVRLRLVLPAEAPQRFFVDDAEATLNELGYLPIPANRLVRVEVKVQDYLNVIKWFNGQPNERMEWEVPLKRIPGPVPGEDWQPPYFDLPMVWFPPGTFQMGSPVTEFRRLPNEDALTRVTLQSGYWIATHEVSQGLYERVMRQNPSHFKGAEYPVDSVTWDDANEFCRLLTEYEGNAGRLPDGFVYRLPTEAEWEYAARAGTTTPFSFGASADPSMGNFHGSYSRGEIAGKSAEDRYGTLPVGYFPPNPRGLYDVHGNVAEWTLDHFWDRHPGGRVSDPVNLESGRGHSLRGGSWEDSADRVRSAAREGARGSTARNSIGFRVVLAPAIEPRSR